MTSASASKQNRLTDSGIFVIYFIPLIAATGVLWVKSNVPNLLVGARAMDIIILLIQSALVVLMVFQHVSLEWNDKSLTIQRAGRPAETIDFSNIVKIRGPVSHSLYRIRVLLNLYYPYRITYCDSMARQKTAVFFVESRKQDSLQQMMAALGRENPRVIIPAKKS